MDTEAFVRSTTTSAKQSVLAARIVCGRLQAHLLFQFMLMQKQGKKSEYRVEHKMGGCGVDRYSLLSDGHIAL